MRVTSKARHAIRALYDLAFHGRSRGAQAKEIARRQKIPLRFLEQILQELRKAGLVEARRGPQGGFKLARAPADVSLAQVLAAVCGPVDDLFAIATVSPAADVPDLVWAEVGGRLVRVLEQTTLADFVARAESAGIPRALPPATMYFI